MDKSPIKSEIWQCQFFDSDDTSTYAFLISSHRFFGVYFNNDTFDIVTVSIEQEFHIRRSAHRFRYTIWDRLANGGATQLVRPQKMFDSPFLKDVFSSKASVNYLLAAEEDHYEILSTKEPTVTLLPKQQPRSVFLKEAQKSFSLSQNKSVIDVLPLVPATASDVIIEPWQTPFSASEVLHFRYARHGFYDSVFIFETDSGELYEVVSYEITPYQLISKPSVPVFYSQLTRGTHTWRCYKSAFFADANDATILYMDQLDPSLRCTYLIETATNFIEIAAPEPMQIRKLTGVTAEERILNIVDEHGYDLKI